MLASGLQALTSHSAVSGAVTVHRDHRQVTGLPCRRPVCLGVWLLLEAAESYTTGCDSTQEHQEYGKQDEPGKEEQGSVAAGLAFCHGAPAPWDQSCPTT